MSCPPVGDIEQKKINYFGYMINCKDDYIEHCALQTLFSHIWLALLQEYCLKLEGPMGTIREERCLSARVHVQQ